MNNRSERSLVAGAFRDESSARAAVKKLAGAQFDPAEISVVRSHHHKRAPVLVREEYRLQAGGLIGAAVGAVSVAVGVTLAGLSFGLLTMTTGLVATTFEAAFVGGCVGFALGTLLGMDAPRLVMDFGSVGVEGGILMVGAPARGARADRVRELLAEAGARHFVESGSGAVSNPELRAA